MKNEPLQDFIFYDYTDIKISFGIKTKVLDLDTLSDFLKLSPTKGWTIDQKYIGKQISTDKKEIEKVERQKSFTLFVFETKAAVNSNRFQDHSEYLLNKLDTIKDNLKDLIIQPDKFEISIFIYLKFDKKQDYFGFYSKSDIIKKLANYCHYIEWRNE